MMILVIFFLSYLLGSVSGAILIGRLLHRKDVRDFGSGNAGATNALRVFGKKAGVLALLVDFGKGVLATWLGLFFLPHPWAYLGAVGVILGHSWPIFHGWKGGKGIATSAGILLVASPWVLVISLSVFILTVILTKIVSLGSVLAALVTPLAAYWVTRKVDFTALALFLSLLALYRHHSNIGRLVRGEEKKIF